MNTRTKRDGLLYCLLLITIFFMPIEMAMEIKFTNLLSPYKISLLLLLIICIIQIFNQRFRKKFLNSVYYGFKKYKLILIPIVLYFIFDLISLFWTRDKVFSLGKYITILPIGILLPFIFYFFSPKNDLELRKKRLSLMYLSQGLMALTLSVVTWLLIFFYSRTFYILRTSLQSDYNQFILAIILGYLCGLYLINNSKIKYRYLLYIAYSVICLPLLITSGSKRAVFFLIPVLLIGVLIFVFTDIRDKKTSIKRFVSLLVSLLIIILGTNIISQGYELKARVTYNDMKEKSIKDEENPPSAASDESKGLIHGFRKERNLTNINQALEEGTALDSRNLIWKIAKEDLKTFSLSQWFFGKGGSEQRDIYQTDLAKEVFKNSNYRGKSGDIPMVSHPHSMIFVELLNGGLLKLGFVLAFVFVSLSYTIKFIFKNNHTAGLILFAYASVFFASQLIDSIRGVLHNRHIWFFLFLIIATDICLYSIKYRSK